MAAPPAPLATAARALAAGRLKEAYPIVAAHLATAPNDPLALAMMGDLAARAGRPPDAARMLARAVALAPEMDVAWAKLAETLPLLPATDAIAELDHQPAAHRRLIRHRMMLAAALERAGAFDEAAALYKQVVGERTDLPGAWLALGHVHNTLGHREQAVAAYRRVIALAPMRGGPWWSLADIKSFRFTPEDVAAMEMLRALPDLPATDRVHLDFALGRALEQQGDYAASFARYAAGNALHRATLHHDPAQLTRETDRATLLLTPDFFAARKDYGCPADDPIFIVGLPRSGSTLVEQMLASHPLIEGTSEQPDLPLMTEELIRAKRLPLWDAVAALTAAEATAMGERYLARTRCQRRTGRPRFVDKLPGNFRHVGLIRLILPHARVIDVRRDPLAAGLSIFKQFFSGGYTFGFDLDDIGRHHVDYAWMMNLWDRRLPGFVHRTHYEMLVADPEGEVRRLLDHLGLPFDPACLDFHTNARAVRTPSGDQVRRPLFTEGLDAWRAYEPWLGPLKDALGAAA